MSSNITFSYGNYIFNPRPLFSINTQALKTLDGTGHGRYYNIALQGDLISTGAEELSSGINSVFSKVEDLKDALNHDGRLLIVECGGNYILSGYPTIEDFTIDHASDNYNRRATYTIEFKMPTTIGGENNDQFNDSAHPPYIEDCQESWDIDFADERLPFNWVIDGTTNEKFGYKVAATHTIDVKARITYTGSESHNTPWQDARDYAIGRLGFDNDEIIMLTGILGLPGEGYFTTYDTFNNFRRVSVNETEGSINVVETFIISPSGAYSLPNNAIETFNINTSQTNGIVTVGIQGEIEGLASISYTGDGLAINEFIVTESKFAAASGYFNLIENRIYDRANTAYSSVAGDCSYSRSLNPTVKSKTIGMNVIGGTITYSYEYDTIPSGCITGSCILSQNITIDDQLATDIFASQTILGRASGPILQDIGTVSARIRNINIELATLPPTGCSTTDEIYSPIPTGAIQDFIDVIYEQLTGNYDQVFTSTNNESWNFTIGRYTKSIGFTYNTCSS